MKTTSIQRLLFTLILPFSMTLALRAATYSWTGGGDGSAWNADANWSTSAPVSTNDADLVFGTASGGAMVNNIASPFLLRNMTFNAAAGSFTISGFPLVLYGNVVNNSSSIQGLGAATTLAADSQWGAGNGSLTLAATLDGQNRKLTKMGTGTLLINGTSVVVTNLAISAGTVEVQASAVVAPTLSLADTTSLRISGGGSVTSATAFAWRALPSGSIGLEEGSVLFTPGFAFGAGTTGGNTGLVYRAGSSNAGGLWNLGNGTLTLGNGFGGSYRYNQLTINNVVITNLSSLGNGDSGMKYFNSLVLTNAAKVFCNNVYIASKGGNTNVFTVTGGSLLDIMSGTTIAFNNTLGNGLIVDGQGQSGGAVMRQSGAITVATILDNASSCGNRLVITNGGWLVHRGGAGTVSVYAGASGLVSNNLFQVTGEGSLVEGIGTLGVGIASGAAVGPVIGNWFIVDEGAVATNLAAISAADIYTGYSTGATNNGIRVANGGRLYSGSVVIGNGVPRAANFYVIDGGTVGSTVVNGTIAIGASGSMRNAMSLTRASLTSGAVTIGNSASNNTVTVGADATWRLGGSSLTVGYGVAGTGNQLVLAGGLVTNLTMIVGDSSGKSNQVVLAGGQLIASSLTVRSGNKIAPVVGLNGLVPMRVSGTATFEAATWVNPSALTGSPEGLFTVLTANAISGGTNLSLEPGTDQGIWSLKITSTEVLLKKISGATLIVVR